MATGFDSADVSKMRHGLSLARDLLEAQLHAIGKPAADQPYAAWLLRAEELDGRMPEDSAVEAGLEVLKGVFLELDRAARGVTRLLDDAQLKSGEAAKRAPDVERILDDLRPRLGDKGLEKLHAIMAQPDPRAEEDRLSPALVLATELLVDAAARQVAALHIIPAAQTALVSHRVAGKLRPFMELPLSAMNSITAKLKIVGWLDISNKKVPQDGTIRPEREGCAGLPLARVRTLPTVWGECICVQFATPEPSWRPLSALGFGADDLQRYETLLRSGGLILHAGLGGSGRRTAVLSALKAVADKGGKAYGALAFTAAYDVPGVSLTIASGGEDMLSYGALLRSFGLRDPDAVGFDSLERQDTFEQALKQAAKGTLVLASLHVPDAVSALRRIFDMGVSADLVRVALKGVCAHRLVRRLCPDCKQPYDPTKEEAAALGAPKEVKLHRAAGCGKCRHTGYRGVVPVLEVLSVDAALRSCLERETTDEEWRKLAVAAGMTPWRETLKGRVLNGSTSLAEALSRGL
ncbi:MAG: ATPase, T2SS/T4P/T4SS family [Elusimicrobiota bacterium]